VNTLGIEKEKIEEIVGLLRKGLEDAEIEDAEDGGEPAAPTAQPETPGLEASTEKAEPTSDLGETESTEPNEPVRESDESKSTEPNEPVSESDEAKSTGPTEAPVDEEKQPQ
jgi:hypothetical protein